MAQRTPKTRRSAERLLYRGGYFGALFPLVVFLIGVAWLGLAGAPAETGLWPVLVLGLTVGLLLARDRHAYSEAVVSGMAQPIVAVMILAWLFAGMLGALMNASGFVEALVWLAQEAGVTGAGYVLAAFAISCAVSTSTGTSLGTLMLCAPLLYPAGGALGSDPIVLIGAILGGATFGDNLSPASDTTIASTVTQGANMGKVVRSRLRYAVPAAAMAVVVFAALGTSGVPPEVEAAILETSPAGLPMLLAPALVVWLLLRHVHLVEGLLLGILAAVILGLALRRFELGEIFFIDPERFTGAGILVEGMERGVGVSIFTLLLMGLVAGVERSGVMKRLLDRAGERIDSPRAAESWIFTTVSAATLVTTHSVVALLAVGRSVRETGRRFGISPERRANILDVTVCTYPFLLPYCIPTVFAASTTSSGSDFGMPVLSALPVGLANFHSWALLLVILVAVLTGWGRDGGTQPSSEVDEEIPESGSKAAHRIDSKEFGTFGIGELEETIAEGPYTTILSGDGTEILDRSEELDEELRRARDAVKDESG
ncbi:MAG: hypothetical protein MPN21_08845 [Thermoanaerobaculia bacterium]|nr:hypothetical protein [Thermoanaerobaculia bacterium]